MVGDIAEEWYVKPDAGRLLCSPADETPTPPCDAQPEELDVAICVDRIETAFDFRVHRIESRWAGLRCFAPDKTPVAGFDPRAPGLFWLAGQGGYGIQTAPALAMLSTALICGEVIPEPLSKAGIAATSLAPARLITKDSEHQHTHI
jgi:D-arginine dehydrogenase